MSDAFLEAGDAMSKRLGIYWPHLLMVMNFESGISPSAHNPGGASGLIQFSDLPGVGWTGGSEEFRALSDVDQLPYVEKFLSWFAKKNLDSVRRIHQAIFVNATLDEGSAPDLVLVRANGAKWGGRESQFYRDNSVFDAEKKGYITAGDLESTDVNAASPPGSAYQRAFARLKELLPEYARDVPLATGSGSTSWKKTVGWWALGGGVVLSGAWLVLTPPKVLTRALARV